MKKILSVGIALASDDVTECEFNSNTSLLDWDIVLFRPDISDFLSHSESFQGKPSLRDSSSFKLKECSEHWRREILDAVQSGKTVIVYLPELVQVYVDTGRREYSGTGRNQKTTTIVDKYDNFRCIPSKLEPITSTGSFMKLASKGAEVLAPYWKEFEELSTYHVILSDSAVPPCLLTKNGDKTVGALYRKKDSTGALLLLPDIDFYDEDFYESSDGDAEWSDVGRQFAARLISELVSLNCALKSSGESTPAPQWVSAPNFALNSESALQSELLQIEEQIEAMHRNKERLVERLEDTGRLRRLLFEKGKPLEAAIIDALKILGFAAAPYRDSESEFDVVFEAPEGRLIGEAEGKDSKAVNVDKLRQLAMNIYEDLQRDTVDQPAKGVLFGNAYRLSPVSDRAEAFTEKCIRAATTSSTALVSTADLFRVARALANRPDDTFAGQCRTALVSGVGVVSFPAVPPEPQQERSAEEKRSEDA